MESPSDRADQGPATLFAAFEKTAGRFPDHVALKGDGGRGSAFTYAGVLDKVRRLAAGLQHPQYADLREVGLLSENRPQWPITYLAVVASGKTVVPIDANLKPNEIKSLIEHAGLRLLFVSGHFEKLLGEFDADLEIISFEPESPRDWERLMADPIGFTPIGSPESVAALIYTSGTTGAPKAVMLTHGNLLAYLSGINRDLEFDDRDVFLSLLPLHHTFEATCGFLTPLTCGCTVVYARSLKSRDIVEDLAANNVTVMCGVPLLFEKIYQSMHRRIQASSLIRRLLFRALFSLSALGWRLKRKWGRRLFAGLRKKAGMSRVRLFVSGAAAMPPHIGRFFVLIGLDFLQGYGMTETSPVISVMRPDDIKFGSVGPPLTGVAITIAEPDENGVGQILVKGDNCTPGYKDNPKQTAELLRDGWLYTGDLGRLQDGHLWITGRAKSLIVSAAGKNIYPEELEEKLMASDYILESIVFARKKENRQGEEVRALIVPDLEQLQSEFGVDPDKPDRDQVMKVIGKAVAEINARMADYKRIVGFDMQYQELEKTSTKKVKRFVYH